MPFRQKSFFPSLVRQSGFREPVRGGQAGRLQRPGPRLCAALDGLPGAVAGGPGRGSEPHLRLPPPLAR